MKRREFAERLRSEVLMFDGAVGTLLLHEAGLDRQPPEWLNVHRPELVEAVHRRYVTAGSHIIQTNTFGGNSVKLGLFGMAGDVRAVAAAGVSAARKATTGTQVLVAGCIGPTGALLEPFGELSAERAYDAFVEQAAALAGAGADLLNIETMTDVLEAKLALIAARTAAPGLPVMVSVTFDRGLRTLTGTDPATAVAILSAAGADVVGTNCGLGPDDAAEVIRQMHHVCDLPLIVKPNAGLPVGQGTATAYRVGPEEFAGWAAEFVANGACVIGGCCGTTPDHIRRVAVAAVSARPAGRGAPRQAGIVASAGRVVTVGRGLPTRIIGERINPSRRPDLQQALRDGDWGMLAAEARAQEAAGADLVDVNVGYRVAGVSEPELMIAAVQAVQHACTAPLSIDTRDLDAMEGALRVIRGKPLLNSTTAEPEVLERVLGLAVRYGAAVIGLPLDSGGVPEAATERLELVERIVMASEKAGLALADLFIDGLTLTAGMRGVPGLETLATIRAAKERLGVSTVLGVSNVSHGLPRRDELNTAFLAMAQANGLDLAIVNPLQPALIAAVRAGDVLTGRDPGALHFTQATHLGPGRAGASREVSRTHLEPPAALSHAVFSGDRLEARRLAEQVVSCGWTPLDTINRLVVPALEEVGRDYEAQRAFLPQLLMAAEAAYEVFASLEGRLLAVGGGAGRGTVVLATVRGDMHDIGKNILALLLRSHGFEVIDLGRDVPAEEIAKRAQTAHADVIGLSALMSTTMPEMGKVSELLRNQGVHVPLIVGGAVVTEEYARSIGAEYAPDAVSGVRKIGELAARHTAPPLPGCEG